MVIIIAGVALLAAAGFVIVSNTRNVTTGPVPDALLPVQRDTSFNGVRKLLTYKTGVLERRYRDRRDSLKTPSPELESLIHSCDSSLTATRTVLTAMDTARTARARSAVAGAARREYARAKELVARFLHVVRSDASLEEDSLDQEMRQLISK
jgi:hypothetical protein